MTKYHIISYHVHADVHAHVHVTNKHVPPFNEQNQLSSDMANSQYEFQLSHSIYYIVAD